MKFFVSSTYKDLIPFRKFTIEYLSNLTDEKTGSIAAMEYFIASEETSLDVCLKELSDSDLVIGIYGTRYGSIDGGSGKSITEIEFDYAVENNIPILAFVTYEKCEEPQSKFIHNKVFKNDSNCARFATLQEYADSLDKSLRDYLMDFEGYSFSSIWGELQHMRKRFQRPKPENELRIPMYEYGEERNAFDILFAALNQLKDYKEDFTEMYMRVSDNYSEYPADAAYQEKLRRLWEDVHISYPNIISNALMSAHFLQLSYLQHRLLTERWTNELREAVLDARDKYIDVANHSYYID